MKKPFLLFKSIIFMLCLFANGFANAQKVDFIRNYRNIIPDGYFSEKSVPLSDNTYLTAGFSPDTLNKSKRIFILKIKPNGDSIFSKFYSDTFFHKVLSADIQYINEFSGGFRIGFVGSFQGNNTSVFGELITDKTGKQISLKTIKMPIEYSNSGIIMDEHGDFILFGKKDSNYLLAKTDTGLRIKWLLKIKDSNFVFVNLVYNHGKVYLAGYFTYPKLGIIQIDSSGKIDKAKNFRTLSAPVAYFYINAYHDGSLIVTGESLQGFKAGPSDSSQLEIIRIPESIDTFQKYEFVFPDKKGLFGIEVVQADTLADHACAIEWAAYSTSFSGQTSPVCTFLSVIGPNNKISFSSNLDSVGGSKDNYSIAATNDSGILLTGINYKDLSSQLIKISGTKTASAINLSAENSLHLTLYPNPASDYINIQGDIKESYHAEILDITGRVVQTYQKTASDKTLQLDRQLMPQGIYTIRLWFGDGSGYAGKVILR